MALPQDLPDDPRSGMSVDCLAFALVSQVVAKVFSRDLNLIFTSFLVVAKKSLRSSENLSIVLVDLA